MKKRLLQKQEKKSKRPHSLKKHQSHLNLLKARKKKMGRTRTNKGKKMPPLLGVKEKVQSFFDPRKESKNLTFNKKVERVVFIARLQIIICCIM